MSTGWRWVRDDGEEFKNERAAMFSLRDRPHSRIVFHELTMAGVRETDVTERLRLALARWENTP